MPRARKRRRYMLEEGLQSQSEAQGLLGSQVPVVKEEEATSFPSCFCSSSPSSPYSSSSSSSSCSSSPSSYSCCYCLVSGYIKALSAATGTPRPLQVPQRANVMAVTPSTKLHQGSNSQEEEGPSTSQAPPDTVPLLRDAIDDEATNLVQVLLLKYCSKEPTTKEEMLSIIIKEYQDLFPEIFSQASECMQLVFGVDVKKVDSSDHSYVLVNNTLG